MLVFTHFLSKLQNASRKKQNIVHFPYSKICHDAAQLLKDEGLIKRVEVDFENSKLWLVLKYQKDTPIIQSIQQYSTCGRSIFWRLSDFPATGLYLLSTSKGILSKKEAFQQQVGGQVLCRIF